MLLLLEGQCEAPGVGRPSCSSPRAAPGGRVQVAGGGGDGAQGEGRRVGEEGGAAAAVGGAGFAYRRRRFGFITILKAITAVQILSVLRILEKFFKK